MKDDKATLPVRYSMVLVKYEFDNYGIYLNYAQSQE